MNKRVVVFGGGTGISFLIRGLKLFPIDLTTVISVADDGSSTGKLREEFYMPAMGDIRQVLTNLASTDDDIKKLMEYRFNTYSDLNGHPIGNLLLVALYNMTGSLSESISLLTKMLDIKQKVLPISEDYLTLMGETVDGEIVVGEDNITSKGAKYKRLFYKDEPRIIPDVLKAVKDADVIIFSIGSLFTSIIPHLLCKDLINAIDNSSARILYTCNAVTQPGETDNFSVSDHINILNQYLGNKKIDAVLAANTSLPDDILDKYSSSENKTIVNIDEDKIEELECELISRDLLVVENDNIRHDPMKTATAVFNYILR